MKKKVIIGILLSFSLVACSTDNSNSTSSIETKKERTQEICPHCNGLGRRVNTITGIKQSCSSCGGDGMVTQEQYDRLSK